MRKAKRSTSIRVPTHGALARYVRELHETGLFGTTSAETAERLLARGVEVTLPLLDRKPPKEDGVLGFATGRRPAP